jgi:hypothetical protein
LGGVQQLRKVTDDMLVTGSPAPGRKEVWVERCERRIVWVAPTEQSRSSAAAVVEEVAGARDGAKDWRVEKWTLRRI